MTEYGNRYGGMFLLLLLTVLSEVGVAGADLQELRTSLDTATTESKVLQGEAQAIDRELMAARDELDKMTRAQAPKEAVLKQKAKVRDAQNLKLKTLTKLLKVEEDRAELLSKIKVAAPPPVQEPVKIVAPEKSTEDILSALDEKKEEIPVAGTEAFGKSKFLEGEPTSVEEFQSRLKIHKKAQGQLEEAAVALRKERQLTELEQKKAKESGDQALSAQLERKLSVLCTREKVAAQHVNDVRGRVLALKKEFESFVASENRNDFIMPGTKLELIVAEDKTFNGTYMVRSGGYIILPRIGRINVAGKSREDAEMTVKKTLEDTQLRIATVLLEPARMGDDPEEITQELRRELLRAQIKHYSGEEGDIGEDVIYLTGAFRREGPWSIPKNFQATLLTTIIRSGGVREDADLSAVRVLRTINGRPVTETVNLQALMDGKPGVMDVKLNADDVIIVPEAEKKKPQNIFITGNVKNPGALQLTFEKKVTAYTAILKAGGFARFANLKKVFILRDLGDGKKVRIPADMKKVKNGDMTDPEVKPNDIIVVPESFFGVGN